MSEPKSDIPRRSFVADGLRAAGVLGVGGAAAWLAAGRGHGRQPLWQLDPDKCLASRSIACDLCQKSCVLGQSAVKAVQCFALCGYCDVCTGYFPAQDYKRQTGAENQLCPTGAIKRKYVDEQAGEKFFEYTIAEELCVGCSKCVAGCRLMNGSLYLQVRHDRCLNCNECAIAVACPAQAFSRVPPEAPNLLGSAAGAALEAQRRKPGLPQAPAEPAPELQNLPCKCACARSARAPRRGR